MITQQHNQLAEYGKLTVVRVHAPTNAQSTRFYCGRGSPLGNRHVMNDRSTSERNRVCDAYKTEFPLASQLPMLREIWWMVRKGHDVELSCFCAPLRCHCDTIKAHIEQHLPPRD
jgi:hypothetical protein